MTGTIGYTSPGSSAQSAINRITGSSFSLSDNAIPGTLNVYLKAYTQHDYFPFAKTSVKVKCAIYDHSTSSLAVETEEKSILETSATWVKFTFPTQTTLSPGDYVLVAWVKSGAYELDYGDIYYDSGATNQGHYKTQTYGTFPDPITFSHEDRKYSIYLEYEVSAPPPVETLFSLRTKNLVNISKEITGKFISFLKVIKLHSFKENIIGITKRILKITSDIMAFLKRKVFFKKPLIGEIGTTAQEHLLWGGVLPSARRAWVWASKWWVLYRKPSGSLMLAVSGNIEDWDEYVVPLGHTVECYNSWLHNNTLEIVVDQSSSLVEYLQATLYSSGSVSFGSINTIYPGTFIGDKQAYVAIVTDSEDCPWIYYNNSIGPILTRSDNSNGVWNETSGFPKTLATNPNNPTNGILVPQGSTDVLVGYSTITDLCDVVFRYCNKDSLGSIETPLSEYVYHHGCWNMIEDSSFNVHVVYFHGGQSGRYLKRTPGSGGTWSTTIDIGMGYVLSPGIAITSETLLSLFYLGGVSELDEVPYYNEIDINSVSITPSMPLGIGTAYKWREYEFTQSYSHPYEVFGLGNASDEHGTTRLLVVPIEWKRWSRKTVILKNIVKKLKDTFISFLFRLRGVTFRKISFLFSSIGIVKRILSFFFRELILETRYLSSKFYLRILKERLFIFRFLLYSLQSKILTFLNNIRETLSRSEKITYLLRILGKRSFILKFGIRILTSRISSLTFLLKELIFRVSSTEFLLRELRKRSLDLKFLVRIIKSLIKTFNWKNLVLIEKLFEGIWSIKGKISNELLFLFHVYQKKVKSLQIINQIRILRSLFLSSFYSLLKIIGRSIKQKFSIRSLLSSLVILKTSLKKRITSLVRTFYTTRIFSFMFLNIKYGVIELRHRINVTKYFLKIQVINLISSLWKSLVNVTYLLRSLNNIIGVTKKILSFLNSLSGLVVKEIIFRFSIKVIINRIFRILYKINNLVIGSLELFYNSFSQVFKLFISKSSLLNFRRRITKILYNLRSLSFKLFISRFNLKALLTRTISMIFSFGLIVYRNINIFHNIRKILSRKIIGKYLIRILRSYSIVLKSLLRSSRIMLFRIKYQLAGLTGRLLFVNYTLREFISSIFKGLYLIKILIRREILFKYLTRQYTLISLTLKYNIKKFINRIYSFLYSVGFKKIYNTLSIKFNVIREFIILTLRIKQILPRFKLAVIFPKFKLSFSLTRFVLNRLQKTLKVKLDTLKYRIKEILRRG